MAHQDLSLIRQAPRCSNCGNHIPLASPWRLAPFYSIKIFPGCTAAMGNIFHTCCRASSTYIRHVYIPFNKYLFGYKSGGRGVFQKKKKKTEKSKKKNTQKNPTFFWWDCLWAPRQPPQYKADSTWLDLWSGSPFFAGQNTNRMHRDLP